MSLSWITINERLQNGVKLINKLPTNKFDLLLTHITQANSDEPFTKEELNKLQESFKLTDAELQLLLQTIAYISKQANKVILKPTALQKQLSENLKFEEEKAEVFVKVWLTETTNSLGEFENRFKLEDVSWELNLETASKYCNKQSKPNARMQLNLLKADENKKENVTLELNEEELLHLYNTLEKIQIKLDNCKQ